MVREGRRETWDAAAANVANAPLQSSATSTPPSEPRAAQYVMVVSQGVEAVTLVMANKVDVSVKW